MFTFDTEVPCTTTFFTEPPIHIFDNGNRIFCRGRDAPCPSVRITAGEASADERAGGITKRRYCRKFKAGGRIGAEVIARCRGRPIKCYRSEVSRQQLITGAPSAGKQLFINKAFLIPIGHGCNSGSKRRLKRVIVDLSVFNIE